MTATALTATAAAWTITPSPTVTASVTATPTRSATPTKTATQTATPTPTRDPNRYYALDDTFSIILPKEWVEVEVGTAYPFLVPPGKTGDPIAVSFDQQKSTFPTEFFSALYQDALIEILEDYEQIGEEFLINETGKDYFRWEFTDTKNGIKIREILYFFGSGDWKLVVIYARPENRFSEFDPVVEKAIETLSFER